MSVRTVKVDNVSLEASPKDIQEFFCFSGDIQYVEMHKDELCQVAYITFKDVQGAETAMLLTGATIVDMAVIVMPAVDYQLPAGALSDSTGEVEGNHPTPKGRMGSALRKAEDIVGAMIAKGFVLGKDAVEKAKAFDEKHQLTSGAAAKVSSLDRKMGLSQKISMGTTAVNEKMKEMDHKYQVSEKTVTALMAAEQKVTSAGTAIMNNQFVVTGTTWVANTLNRVGVAASEATSKVKERIAGELEQKQVGRDIPHAEQEQEQSERDVPLVELEKEQAARKLAQVEQEQKQAEGHLPQVTADKTSETMEDRTAGVPEQINKIEEAVVEINVNEVIPSGVPATIPVDKTTVGPAVAAEDDDKAATGFSETGKGQDAGKD